MYGTIFSQLRRTSVCTGEMLCGTVCSPVLPFWSRMSIMTKVMAQEDGTHFVHINQDLERCKLPGINNFQLCMIEPISYGSLKLYSDHPLSYVVASWPNQDPVQEAMMSYNRFCYSLYVSWHSFLPFHKETYLWPSWPEVTSILCISLAFITIEVSISQRKS